MKKVRIFGISDIGCVRRENEDSFWVHGTGKRVVALVADGMGGHVAGKLASATAVDVLRHHLESKDGFKPVEEKMEDGMFRAHKRIEELAREHAPNARMGTTCTMAVLERFPRQNRRQDDALRLLIGHVGDSRLYRLREGNIEQVTTDHTMLQRMLEAGAISAAEAREYEHKNVIYKSLGGSENLQLDPVTEHEVHPGELLLLCSDGLTGHVKAEEIHAVVRATRNLEAAGHALVELARQRGGSDNITAVLLEYGRFSRLSASVSREQMRQLLGKSPGARNPRHWGTILVLMLILVILGGVLTFHVLSKKGVSLADSDAKVTAQESVSPGESVDAHAHPKEPPVQDNQPLMAPPLTKDGKEQAGSSSGPGPIKAKEKTDDSAN